MHTTLARTIEYVFFFGVLAATAYLMWHIIAPFFTALAIVAVVTTVCYPFYRRIRSHTPFGNESVASAVTTLVIVAVVIVPLVLLGYLIFSEARDLYDALRGGEGIMIDTLAARVEGVVRQAVPTFTLDFNAYAQQVTGWFADRAGQIFAGTASTLLLTFITVIGFFYAFRDGEMLVRHLVAVSPLPDGEDSQILERLARSVRAVILGTLTVALIQGVLTAIGLTIFGFEQVILWGAVAAFGALIPGIGTSIVLLPAIIFLVLDGSYSAALGLTVWAALAVGLVDNLLGPYLMSRGVTLHPFFILLSVLGGLALFGPIGFVLGPVALSLFTVLLELYSGYMHPAALIRE